MTIASFGALILATTALLGATGCQDQKKPTGKPGTAAGDRATANAPGAPAQSAEELNAPLATVDEVVITLGDFQSQLNRQSPYVRARYASLEQKKEFLDSLVKFEVLAKEAQKRGFDKDPEVVRTMKQVMIQKLMKEEFETKVTPDSVPEADMKAYYDANLAEYVKPEEVRASAIIVKSKAQAERAATEAKGEAGKTNKGFRELVTKFSVDEETKLRGGDLRYFAKDNAELPAAVVAAAFALPQTGDVSAAIDAGGGKFYVVKQTGRRKATTKTFDDAKPMIRNKLYRDRRIESQNQFVAALKGAAKIVVNDANLAKVKIDTSQAPGADPHGHMMETPGALPGVPSVEPEQPPVPGPGLRSAPPTGTP